MNTPDSGRYGVIDGRTRNLLVLLSEEIFVELFEFVRDCRLYAEAEPDH